jgi:hypothetical protein
VEGDQKTIEVALIKDSDEIQKGDMRRNTIVPGIDDGGKKFVVANIVPTGVRAEIGGWIGEKSPILMAEQKLLYPIQFQGHSRYLQPTAQFYLKKKKKE